MARTGFSLIAAVAACSALLLYVDVAASVA